MTEAVAVYELNEDFYIPAFRVEIDGRDLPTSVIWDVLQVTYRDKVGEIDSLELLINNWDAEAQSFKYEPPLSQHQPNLQGLFDPGSRVKLKMGYQGHNDLTLMLTGEITTLEPNYPESGAPTLSLRGLNVLHKFRKEPHTWAWERQTISSIAQWLGQQQESRQRPGLGIRVEVHPRDEQTEEYVMMNNQYDITFLLEQAQRHGYKLALIEEQTRGRTEQRLYFGPPDDESVIPTYKLEWGKSLVSFRPTLTTHNQISQVTVRGWDRRTGRAFEETAQLGQRGIEINRDQHAVAQAVQGRHEIITDRPVHTRAEARSLARDFLLNQLGEMVRASGVTVGLPLLRAGRRVQLLGLGARFSGEYYVTETTHTIGSDGYRTTFQARREGPVE